MLIIDTISNNYTVCPPKYDGSIISQYTWIQFIYRGNRGRKLEWGCCKFVATGKVLDKSFHHISDTCILSKIDP